MALYITLYKWTEQGIKNIKDAPERIKASAKALEAVGGKLVSVYLTMGEYDLVSVNDCPNDEIAATMLLNQAMQGNIRSVTLKAFSLDQFSQIVKKLS